MPTATFHCSVLGLACLLVLAGCASGPDDVVGQTSGMPTATRAAVPTTQADSSGALARLKRGLTGLVPAIRSPSSLFDGPDLNDDAAAEFNQRDYLDALAMFPPAQAGQTQAQAPADVVGPRQARLAAIRSVPATVDQGSHLDDAADEEHDDPNDDARPLSPDDPQLREALELFSGGGGSVSGVARRGPAQDPSAQRAAPGRPRARTEL